MNTTNHTFTAHTELVCSEDQKHTYEIIKRLEGFKGGTVVFITLFPTHCPGNMHIDGSTVTNLVEHAPELGISTIHIMNLFSQVCTSRLYATGLTVDEDNLAYVANRLQELGKDAKVVLAWGNSMMSCKAAIESKKRIVDMYHEMFPKGKLYTLVCPDRGIFTPAVHPLFLGIRAADYPWQLLEINKKK